MSPIFKVKKRDDGTRFILNLKELNEFVKYEHIEMDSIKNIINMFTRNCFMATVDLKDAYYIVAIRNPRNPLNINGKKNSTALHVFQMFFGLPKENSLN